MRGKWVVKAIVQKAISVLPNAQRVNYFFQDRITHGTVLTDEFLDLRLRWSGMHLRAMQTSRQKSQGQTSGEQQRSSGAFTALELGTGWFPIVPLCLFVAGAERVTSCDLEDLSNAGLARQAIEGVLRAAEDGRLGAQIGDVDPDRLARLAAVGEKLTDDNRLDLLAGLGLVVINGDARELELDHTPDLICSNTVFEHIPPAILVGILERFAELSGPGTAMSHLVDLCDHYAYFDESVSVYNFLRYSDRVWKLIDNSLQPMNRLRASEYVDLYEQAGVEATDVELDGCAPLDLVGEPLAPRFKAMDPSDVSCTSVWLVTRF